MCILIAKPAGAVVDLTTMKNCWDHCPEGAGVAYATAGKVIIEKGFMTWDAFTEFIIEPEQWADIPMLIHFRLVTAGDDDADNTHPFEVIPDRLAFAHNGTLNLEVKERPDLSDSNVFCRYVLKQLPHNFLSNSGITTLIYQALGDHSKMAFLDGDGTITIFNQELGIDEADGVWFSNKKYRPTYVRQVFKDRGWTWPDAVSVATPSTAYADWYCGDCCIWFDEHEGPDPLEEGDDPCCPLCGTNANASFDPLNFPEEESNDNPLDTCVDGLLGYDVAQPW